MNSIDYILKNCNYAFLISPQENMYSSDYCIGCNFKKTKNPKANLGKFTTVYGLCNLFKWKYEPIQGETHFLRIILKQNLERLSNCKNKLKVSLEKDLKLD